MRRPVRAGAQNGFTLIELMVAVAILVVLGFAAVNAYRKHMDNARKSEVVSMFAEIRAREEAYRAEFSQYASISANETDYYPVLLGVGEPAAKTWAPATASWNAAGVNPGKLQVYCGYAVVAGAANSSAGMGALGQQMFPAVPTTPWWYATATCDNDGDSSVNALFATSVDSQSMFEQNPHR